MERKREILLRSVIKEELVILTMHRDEAAILQQFLYWTPRCNSYQLFLTEETLRMQQELLECEGGWIYKTAEQLKHELLMIDTNVKSIRKYLKSLVEKGFLFRRKNPKWKVDRTYQYRINLRKVVDELNNLGHHLEGFEQFSIDIKETKVYYLYHRNQGHCISADLSDINVPNVTLDNDNLDDEFPKEVFPSGKKSETIPESTSKIKNKEQITNDTSKMNDEYNLIVNKFLSLSRKKSVSKEDQELIQELLALVKDVSEIISLMEDCYKLKNQLDLRAARGNLRGSAKGIWSFKYVYNYIRKELDEIAESYQKTDGEKDIRSRNRGLYEEPDYKADDEGWVGDTKCDF